MLLGLIELKSFCDIQAQLVLGKKSVSCKIKLNPGPQDPSPSPFEANLSSLTFFRFERKKAINWLSLSFQKPTSSPFPVVLKFRFQKSFSLFWQFSIFFGSKPLFDSAAAAAAANYFWKREKNDYENFPVIS